MRTTLSLWENPGAITFWQRVAGPQYDMGPSTGFSTVLVILSLHANLPLASALSLIRFFEASHRIVSGCQTGPWTAYISFQTLTQFHHAKSIRCIPLRPSVSSRNVEPTKFEQPLCVGKTVLQNGISTVPSVSGTIDLLDQESRSWTRDLESRSHLPTPISR